MKGGKRKDDTNRTPHRHTLVMYEMCILLTISAALAAGSGCGVADGVHESVIFRIDGIALHAQKLETLVEALYFKLSLFQLLPDRVDLLLLLGRWRGGGGGGGRGVSGRVGGWTERGCEIRVEWKGDRKRENQRTYVEDTTLPTHGVTLLDERPHRWERERLKKLSPTIKILVTIPSKCLLSPWDKTKISELNRKNFYDVHIVRAFEG